jgi:hypothetical protein
MWRPWYLKEFVFEAVNEGAGGPAIGQYEVFHVELHFTDR